jgi:AcrR family transcriptional regulator
MKLIEPEEATREHLLDVAGEVFAEVGFRAATVRQICQRAGANIAAVNYHFGDKEKLYAAVLRKSVGSAFEKYPPDLGLKPNSTPEEKLHAFIRSYLLRIFSEGPSARHGKLLAREMVDPTGALEGLVREHIRPMAGLLFSIIGPLLGPGADQMTARRCGMSVVSQMLFYHNCRPVIRLLFPDMKFGADQIEALADHITRFSLAAIKGIAREEKEPKNRKAVTASS